MVMSILSVAAGASIGALLRWLLAGRFNPLFPALPLGTLAANLIGGYLIGVAVAIFANLPELSPQARLFVVTCKPRRQLWIPVEEVGAVVKQPHSYSFLRVRIVPVMNLCLIVKLF